MKRILHLILVLLLSLLVFSTSANGNEFSKSNELLAVILMGKICDVITNLKASSRAF